MSTTREKIIVGLMLLVVVYGVYTIFFSKPRQPAAVSSDKGLETLNTFITKVAEKSKSGVSEQQAYILRKAQAAWKQDPLIQIAAKKTVKEENIKESAFKSKIVFTGFLQMGDARLAIINGVEYEVGDKLEPGGFLIRNIYPNRVVLTSPDLEKKTFILPMEETD